MNITLKTYSESMSHLAQQAMPVLSPLTKKIAYLVAGIFAFIVAFLAVRECVNCIKSLPSDASLAKYGNLYNITKRKKGTTI